jgi:hypothetical protein
MAAMFVTGVVFLCLAESRFVKASQLLDQVGNNVVEVREKKRQFMRIGRTIIRTQQHPLCPGPRAPHARKLRIMLGHFLDTVVRLPLPHPQHPTKN